MSNEKTQKSKFHKEFTMFKDHRNPDYELKNIFEIYLPFWFCRQNVVVERDIDLDRFSRIILQTIQSGFTKHSEICRFLGVKTDAFVTMQFHFLVKNNLLSETPIPNDTKYDITFDGLSFLERKKKITAVETVGFEYFYNDLTREFLDKQRFDTDDTKDFADTQKPFASSTIPDGSRKKFSGYQVLQTKLLPANRNEISHSKKPYDLNKVEFANFFNKHQSDSSFYDFDSSKIETHKRSICFLAFEYEDIAGVRVYEIRHFKKTVKDFDKYDIEDKLTKMTTEYWKKNPLRNVEMNMP